MKRTRYRAVKMSKLSRDIIRDYFERGHGYKSTRKLRSIAEGKTKLPVARNFAGGSSKLMGAGFSTL